MGEDTDEHGEERVAAKRHRRHEGASVVIAFLSVFISALHP
jgi:hypothetical protein